LLEFGGKGGWGESTKYLLPLPDTEATNKTKSASIILQEIGRLYFSIFKGKSLLTSPIQNVSGISP
jgi:hypothetical protein